MKIIKTIILLTFFLLVMGCNNLPEESDIIQPKNDSKLKLSGEIHISGAYALYPLVKAWSVEFMKEYPCVQIYVAKTGTGQGIVDVLSNYVNLSMISREIIDKNDTMQLWKVGVARTAVVPIINKNNPYFHELMSRGLSQETLLKLFTSPYSFTWGEILGTDSDKLVSVFIRDDLSGTTEVWANFLKCNRSDLKGYIISGDDSMIKGINKTPFSIGYCNLIYAYDIKTNYQVPGIQVLPLDLNKNGRVDYIEKVNEEFNEFRRAICIGKYSNDLCRNLYIISKDKPKDEATLEFLKWILTEGQEIVEANGYAKLTGLGVKNAFSKFN